VFRDSVWAFGGSSWSARDAHVWVSADGERWERVVSSAPWGPRVYVGALTFDDQLWILGGVHPDGRRLNDVWSSRTGHEWRQVAAAAPWTRRAGNRAVVYRTALWLFGGKGEEENGQSGYASDIWRLHRNP
jgi:N-acetylneuraminic acid mutarotase